MAHQHYRSPFGDTTFTKVFVGGLAWETPTDVMRSYFEQFGEILEAVIITDKNTGKSKGYGFVTFHDPESARRACADPNPMIDGRRANCNIASLGRPRPSPPRGRNQVANIYQGSGIAQGGSSSYLPLPPPPPPPPVPPPPSVLYPSYGYTSYPPDYGYQQKIAPDTAVPCLDVTKGGEFSQSSKSITRPILYGQTMYNPHVHQTQYYSQLYGTSSSALGAPYYYGYSLHSPRGAFPTPAAHRFQGPSYLYYPTQVEGTSSTYPPTPHPLPLLQQPMRHSLPSSADSPAPPQTSTETEAGPATSTSSTA